jgi:hypothetical protein
MWQTRVLPIWLAVLTTIEGVLAKIAPVAMLADSPEDSVLGSASCLFWARQYGCSLGASR